jgi:CNT family concentrative nucleoside transporter
VTERFTSGLGVLALMGLAFLLCPNARRRAVKLRTVGGGLLILIVVAVIVLKTPVRDGFGAATDAVNALLGFSDRGAEFVFGKLALEKYPVDDETPWGRSAAGQATAWGLVFAFRVLPTIVFFAALMSLLYYLGVMPFVVRMMGRALARVLGLSGAESFSTVSDVFVGQTEAPLAIRPYIARLTPSELFACMVAGFATTAGGVLAAYVRMLGPHVEGVAGHFIACSVMAAPASIVVAKLMMPEVDSPETMGLSKVHVEKNAVNVFDALATGTTDGIKLSVNVGAMLIAFTALVAMLNGGLGWLGSNVLGLESELTLQKLLGWAFAPLAWLLGVPAADVEKVGGLLGQKTVVNEFLAYGDMSARLQKDAAWLTERGRVIASYALCGFANFASIGIQIGGWGALSPERRGDLSRLALRAMFGGLLATCMVAAVAGVFL